MARLDPPESKKSVVRVLEQCKRGLAASVIIALFGLFGLLVYVIADTLLSFVSFDPLAEAAIKLGAGAFSFLWPLGDRDTLRMIGDIGNAPDTAD